MSEWVSVKKAKPEPGLCVLVCGDGAGNVFTAAYAGRGRWTEWCTDERDGGVPQWLPFKPSHWQHTPDAMDSKERLRRKAAKHV